MERLYEVFYRISGLITLTTDENAKKRFLEQFKSTKKPMHAQYPIGILALAAYARKKFKNKVELHIIDMLQRRFSVDDAMAELDKISPDLVGLSAFSSFSGALHSLAARIKEKDPKCRVVAGGAYCSASSLRAAADPNLDCVAYGEGEETFVEIIEKVLKGASLKGTNGTAHFEGGKVVINNPRPMIEDIDTLPFPAVDLIDVPGYWGNLSALAQANPWMLTFNSRGCPYHCIYCHRIFEKRTRFMSPKRTADEIMYYNKTYGIEEFHVWDDIFNLDIKRGIELSKLIAKKKKNFRFLYLGGLRADIMDKNLLTHMIKAGCCYICYAVESASPRVQKLIHKNLKLTKAAEAINFTSDAGVWVNTYNMLGFPTETKDEMQKTIDYNCSLKHHSIRLFKVIPQEGTGLYDMIASMKVGTGESGFYVDYDELYSKEVTLKEFEEIVRNGWQKFYFNSERIERTLNMNSKVLSKDEIKLMYAIELLGVMNRCGIKDMSGIPSDILPHIARIFHGISLPQTA